MRFTRQCFKFVIIQSREMKYILYLCCPILIIIACNKDKFQTKPQLTLKSTSDKIIPPNGSFHVVFEFTDKEGDIGDSIFYKKVRVNVRTTSPLTTDTIRYLLPKNLPNSTKGDIDITIPYTDLVSAITPLTVPGSNPPRLESDSLLLRFAISDNAKNHSDTVDIPGVVVQRN
jgi:hypothetical protein